MKMSPMPSRMKVCKILSAPIYFRSYPSKFLSVTCHTFTNPCNCLNILLISSSFKFHNRIPESINEREGFADLIRFFIRGALTLAGIESRYSEVFINGMDDRKNISKNLLIETKDRGEFCDGLAFYGANLPSSFFSNLL